MGQKVHLDNEAEYLELLEEARKTEQILYGVHEQEWEEQKYLNRLRRQRKRQERETKELETYWALEKARYRDWETDRKSTRLNSSHRSLSRMPSSA